MSLGGPGASAARRNAINAAFNAGHFCVAAAGNSNVDSRGTYPASYQNMINVGASDSWDR